MGRVWAVELLLYLKPFALFTQCLRRIILRNCLP